MRSRRSSRSGRSAGSKPCASTPRRWSAASTACPLISDTSRSLELPPSSTADAPELARRASTRRSAARVVTRSRISASLAPRALARLADDAHLGLEHDAVHPLHRGLHVADQLLELARRAPRRS